VLTKRRRADCLHIACAIYSRCKYLLSWNFDDLSKNRTNEGAREVSKILHYPAIEILLPFSLKL
jgi:hypothetical protein